MASKCLNDNHDGEMGFSGNYLSYGVRELGVSAIINGMSPHGDAMSYGATSLMFLDSAFCMVALMKIRSISVLLMTPPVYVRRWSNSSGG